MSDSVLIALIGVVSTVTSSFVGWLLAKRKYKVSVDSNEIDNLRKSLEFYEKIVTDNNKKLDFYIKLAEDNRVEVYRLRGVVHKILVSSCLDGTCVKRVFYTDEQVREILGDTKPLNNEEYKS
jgi:hypothetical protein|nr:MAG TPA: hypothetical protein [Crassvirales sp.]